MSNTLFAQALEAHGKGRLEFALDRYLILAEMGYEVAEANAAMLFDDLFHSPSEASSSLDAQPSVLPYLHQAADWLGIRHPHLHGSPEALFLYERAADQGNFMARIKVGDFYYYGYGGLEPDPAEAAAHYRIASDGRDPQAYFNLGFQHHFGIGLPLDVHLAKRYYDLALESSADAKLPVSLALLAMWFRNEQPTASSEIKKTESVRKKSATASSDNNEDVEEENFNSANNGQGERDDDDGDGDDESFWGAQTEFSLDTVGLFTLVAIFLGLQAVRERRRRGGNV